MTFPSPSLRSFLRQLLLIGGVALASFLSARLLISLSASPSGPVTTIWVPSGIAVAALVLAGPRAAIGSFLGSLAVALEMGSPLPLALAVSVGNAGGELLCWWLLAGRRRAFSIDKVTDGLRLAAGATAAGIVSATASVWTYIHFGFIPAQAFVASWLSWVGSGVSSIVLVAPVLVILFRHANQPLPARPARVEYAAALLLLMAAAFFWQGPHLQRGVNEPVILLLIVGQLWIAFRFSPAAMTVSNCAVGAAAVFALVMRLGHAPPTAAYAFILSLQLMLAGLALVGYLLAAMVERQRLSTQALKEAQGALVNAARDAGRAEVATNVLHNVGNVLNSVNVSAQLMLDRVEASKTEKLVRAVQMLEAHQADLGAYLAHDPKGKLLPAYLGQVAGTLAQEQRELKEEMQMLARHIDHIKEVVTTQQGYAGVSTVTEPVRMTDLVEDALRLDQHALARAGVTVVREFDEVPALPLDRSRVLQILVNLVSNARHALAAAATGSRRLTVRVAHGDGTLQVSVSDDGEGIPAENLTRIFSHGFTTRRDGHGFGLHSCALAAAAMGGTLVADSDGPGTGATFTLRLTPAPMPQAAS